MGWKVEFSEYLAKFAKTHGITPEEASKHKICKIVAEIYIAEEKENERNNKV